jgi:hypothetical protein
MYSRSLLFCLLVLPAAAFADANEGQFMGYKLGTDYPTTPHGSESTTTGNLLIVAEDPVKPADIKQVRLVATPVSRTIGYIDAASWYATESEAREVARHFVELLRVKYPDWKFGREAMDANLSIVEVNFDKAPYNLQLRLVMGLGWQPNSSHWLAWQDMAATQVSAKKSTEREQILEESDVRGL